jgi:hypothetical protein
MTVRVVVDNWRDRRVVSEILRGILSHLYCRLTSNAPSHVPTAPHTSTGTTAHSLPVRHDSSAPYSARSSGTGERNATEQTQSVHMCVAAINPRRDSRSNDRLRSDARPRKDRPPRNLVFP